MPTVLPEDSPLRAYYAHGVYLNNGSSGQAITECPFCRKEEKFYVDRETGLYQCFVCHEKGNPLEFLRKLHERCLETTTEDQYKELARERKYLNIASLMEWEFAYNDLKGEWIVPGYFSSGDNRDKLKQLYRWTDYKSKDGKNHLQATPGFPHCIYGVREFDNSKSDVYICEGPFDALPLIEILQCTKVNEDGTFEFTGNIDASLYANVNVLAIPSTTIFPVEWMEPLLSGKRVYLLLDNDHPRNVGVNGNTRIEEGAGWKGYQSIIRKIIDNGIRPSEMYFLHWGKGYKEHSYNPHLKSGYDVRDLLGEGYKNLVSDCQTKNDKIELIEQRIKNLESFYTFIQPVSDKWIDPTSSGSDKPSKKGKEKDIGLKLIHCESWNELINQWKEAIVWHDGADKTFSAMLACIASVLIPGTQVWLRVISEPSTGKSILCDALCVNQNYVSMQSNIRGFFSGMRPTKKQASQGITDLGLLEEINMKAFVTKDADPILQSVDRPRIMAEARDLFDGKTNTHFRTGMGKKYPKIRTVWIMCGTPRVRDIDDNDLGGRFIDCVIIKDITTKLKSDITRSAIRNMFEMLNKRVDVNNLESFDNEDMLKSKKMTGGYIEYICKNGEKLMGEIQRQTRENNYQEVEDTIDSLSGFVAKMRTRPGKKDEFITEELPARLGEQFMRLAGCLALVLNEEYINTRVLRRVAELAYDTSQGSVFMMTKYLYNNQKGATQEELWKVVKRHEREFKELIRFLVRLKAFECPGYGLYSSNGYGDARYVLSQDLRRICQKVFTYMEHIL